MAWDAAIVDYYDNARWYNPLTARFESQDPLSFAANDPNTFRFVFNQPTGTTDPSGLLADDEVPRGPGDSYRQGQDNEEQYRGIDRAQEMSKKRRPKTKGLVVDPDWEGEKRPKQNKINSTGKSKQRADDDLTMSIPVLPAVPLPVPAPAPAPANPGPSILDLIDSIVLPPARFIGGRLWFPPILLPPQPPESGPWIT